MRIWIAKCKRFCRDFSAFLFCLAGAIVFCVCRAEKFPLIRGEREYYLYSASSQAKQKSALSIGEISRIQGESVRFSLSDEAEARKKAEEILKSYHAKLVKTERVGEILSYYAYTPVFSKGVWIEGKKVNLHIAWNEETKTAAAGSPLLFGGY